MQLDPLLRFESSGTSGFPPDSGDTPLVQTHCLDGSVAPPRKQVRGLPRPTVLAGLQSLQWSTGPL